MVISMAIRVMEGEFDGRARGEGNGDIGRVFGGVVGEEGRSFDGDIVRARAEGGERGNGGEDEVWTVSRQALERADLECFWQEKK
jgi:hypothetical protein